MKVPDHAISVSERCADVRPRPHLLVRCPSLLLSQREGSLVARRTFFSFHYEVDVWRASVARNSAQLKPSIEVDFIDASLWEKSKLSGDAALQKLIDDALIGTSVTAVLIGSRTPTR